MRGVFSPPSSPSLQSTTCHRCFHLSRRPSLLAPPVPPYTVSSNRLDLRCRAENRRAVPPWQTYHIIGPVPPHRPDFTTSLRWRRRVVSGNRLGATWQSLRSVVTSLRCRSNHVGHGEIAKVASSRGSQIHDNRRCPSRLGEGPGDRPNPVEGARVFFPRFGPRSVFHTHTSLDERSKSIRSSYS